MEGLRIIQIIVGPGAEILDVGRDLDLGNASLDAALGPVGVHDPIRPNNIRRCQSLLLLRLDLVLMRPGNSLVAALGDANPNPQNNDQKK